jgi:hypothetical protein
MTCVQLTRALNEKTPGGFPVRVFLLVKLPTSTYVASDDAWASCFSSFLSPPVVSDSK